MDHEHDVSIQDMYPLVGGWFTVVWVCGVCGKTTEKLEYIEVPDDDDFEDS